MAVYLDWNATTPLRPEARAAYLQACDETWGNPSSSHAWGQRARHALDQARLRISALLGCRAHELVVTSGGTEANALAIHSVLAHGGDAVVSAIEHSSVLRNVEAACARHGGVVQRVAVDADGRVSAQAVLAALGPRTRLVCVQFANNELGTIHDVAAIATAVHQLKPEVAVLVDCCQAPGKTPFTLAGLGADLASFAGHKFGAMKGVGLLYVRQGQALEAQLHGGRQQQDRRSGSEDAALALALAAALEVAMATQHSEGERQQRLLTALWDQVHTALPAARWLGQASPRIANTLSLAHPGCRREDLVARLDLAGFAVSPGAACMAARGESSHVIAALGLPPGLAAGAIRVSIGWATTSAQLQAFARAYIQEVGAERMTNG